MILLSLRVGCIHHFSGRRPKSRHVPLLFALVTASGLGCHTVGFNPVETPSTTVSANISLYCPTEIREATYSFRAFSSGIANRWTVPYGSRLVEFARAFLCTPSRPCRDAQTPDDINGSDILVRINGAEYSVANQAAHVRISIEVVDAAARRVLAKDYGATGPSTTGLVMGGGAFTQKAGTRSSTDEAFQAVFVQFVADLDSALDGQQPDP